MLFRASSTRGCSSAIAFLLTRVITRDLPYCASYHTGTGLTRWDSVAECVGESGKGVQMTGKGCITGYTCRPVSARAVVTERAAIGGARVGDAAKANTPRTRAHANTVAETIQPSCYQEEWPIGDRSHTQVLFFWCFHLVLSEPDPSADLSPVSRQMKTLPKGDGSAK